jgi:hypothetical protein
MTSALGTSLVSDQQLALLITEQLTPIGRLLQRPQVVIPAASFLRTPPSRPRALRHSHASACGPHDGRMLASTSTAFLLARRAVLQKKSPARRGAGARRRGLAYPASLGRLVPVGARSNRRPRFWSHRFGLIQLCGLLRDEGVYQRYLALASLQLMTSLAVGRTIANVNPPAAVPQITGADT